MLDKSITVGLEPQFYDQLQQRLNRQDDALESIEKKQDELLTVVRDTQQLQAEHTSSDAINFRWITWALAGAWATIGSIIAYLGKQ